jgi:hypothetical protein
MPINLPYLTFGEISESGTGVSSATVKVRNESTNELLTTTTNASGLYVFDLANFTSGYTIGDTITVYTIYQNFDGQSSFTIASSVFDSEIDIALSAVSDSTTVDYTTVQRVYDELDGKTSSDISTQRIIDKIQEAEGIIDLRTQTSFKSNTVTNEVHTVDRYTIESSPDFLDTFNNQVPQRADFWFRGTTNRVRVDRTPIIAISALSRNAASGSESDSWTALTEQTGSSGDFVIADKEAGTIDFLNDFPRLGKRSWRVSYTWGHAQDSTDPTVISKIRAVRRLTTLLAAKMVIGVKASGSMFDSTRDIRIGTIELRGGGQSVRTYLSQIDIEINELWNTLGELGIEII